MENFRDLFYITEFNGKELECLDRNTIINLLKIDEETFDKLIYRTIKQCNNFGVTYLFRYNLNYQNDKVCEIGIVGLYLFVLYNSELKKYKHFSEYIPFFKEISFNICLSLLNKYVKPKAKKKRVNSNYSFEDAAVFGAKTISTELRHPDLDKIENKEHIFYNKSIVITGEFEKFTNRNEIAKLVSDSGGLLKTTVNSKTDIVIIGSDAGPKKLATIAELKIKTISENEFYNLFELAE